MILVPVKDLAQAKQRLAPALSSRERAELAFTMLRDVARALKSAALRAPGFPEVALVTGDRLAQSLAEEFRFHVIEDRENPGETEAIRRATEVAIGRGASFTLVLPADAPLVTAQEILFLLGSAPEQGAVLVPAADGEGTNGILRRPAALFPLSFGDHSFLPHRRAAESTGKPVRVLPLAGLGLDIDRPSDLGRLAELPGETGSQRFVRALELRGALPASGVGRERPR